MRRAYQLANNYLLDNLIVNTKTQRYEVNILHIKNFVSLCL
jgi:hypothetical protein